MRVLIADDEATTRHLIQVTLGNWGFEVLAAEDGTEALRILNGSNPPEIALLDWMMPGADGLEVCRRMRAALFSAPTYLILVTARGGLKTSYRGLKPGPTITSPSPLILANCAPACTPARGLYDYRKLCWNAIKNWKTL